MENWDTFQAKTFIFDIFENARVLFNDYYNGFDKSYTDEDIQNIEECFKNIQEDIKNVEELEV